MTLKPEEMSRAELVAQLRSLEARLRDDEDRQQLVHDLRVHQEELEAQQVQLVEAQQALEHARDLYADLFEFAPLGYVMLDSAGIVEQINGAALALIGITDRMRVARLPFSIFVVENDRQTFRTHLRVLRAGADHSQTEVRLVDAGARQQRIVQVHTRVWTQRETGEPRYLSALIDVTERWRAQEERRAAQGGPRGPGGGERGVGGGHGWGRGARGGRPTRRRPASWPP